ncbi:hypothetical protein BX070DRAFT_228314 [Coemansia spiralis]|nr:hypothetical protein BX070DRAFT_228314 [Coemansia spiralis]
MSSAPRIKVSNVSQHVDSVIIEKLFSFIGPVSKVDLHQSTINPDVQEALVEFEDARNVKPALFLTGTEIADRTLAIAEDNAGASASSQAAAGAGGGALAMPLANPSVVAMMASRPRSLNAIPANVAAIIHPSVLQFDPVKAEEISRTIYVGNIASWVTEQQLMDFFSACGPVAYVKMAGDGLQPTRFSFIEFADVQTAQAALQMNGMMLADRPLKVNHSKNSINKPQRPGATGGLGALAVPSSVPTLAATASLPSSVDPVAASMLAANATIQARLQATRPPGTGLAWPVLGNASPMAAGSTPRSAADETSASQHNDQYITRKIRELQTQMEDKYAERVRSVDGGSRRRSNSSDRESSGSRRRRRHESPSVDRARESGRYRESSRSPSRRSRRRRSPSRRDYYDGSRRSRQDDSYWYSRSRDPRSRSSERRRRR